MDRPIRINGKSYSTADRIRYFSGANIHTKLARDVRVGDTIIVNDHNVEVKSVEDEETGRKDRSWRPSPSNRAFQ